MKIKLNRILCLVLSLIIVCGMLPVAHAELPTISNLRVEDGVFKWDAFPEADSYNYSYSISGGYLEETSYNAEKLLKDYGMESGTYTFRVAACDASRNEISEIAEIDYTYTALGELDTPTNLSWVGKTARWDAVENAGEYYLSIYEEGNGTAVLTKNVTDNFYDVSGEDKLIADVNYCFTVRAKSTEGYVNSSYSEDSDYAKVGSRVLGEITNLKLTPDGTVVWDEYEGADCYYCTFADYNYIAEEPELDIKGKLVSLYKPSGSYPVTVAALNARSYLGGYEISKVATITYNYVNTGINAEMTDVDFGTVYHNVYERTCENPVITNTGTVFFSLTGAYAKVALTAGDTDAFTCGWNSGGGAIDVGYRTDNKAYVWLEDGLDVGEYSATLTLYYDYDGSGTEHDWEVVDTCTVTASVEYQPVKNGNAVITAPASGQNPVFTATSEDPTKYTASVYQWVRKNDGTILEPDDKFECGEVYTAIVKFEPVTPYVLDPDNSFTVNGKATGWTISGFYRTIDFDKLPDHADTDSNYKCDSCGEHVHGVSSYYANDEEYHWRRCPDPSCYALIEGTKQAHTDLDSDGVCDVCNRNLGEITMLDEAVATFDMPQIGDAVGGIEATAGSGNYTVTFRECFKTDNYSSLGAPLDESDAFAEGETYVIEFTFKPKTGYDFASSCAFKINDDAAPNPGGWNATEREYYKRTMITMPEHEYENYVPNNDATCKSNATETGKCKWCEETDTREIPDSKVDHKYENYVSNNDATCKSNATETGKCKWCEATDTREIPDSKAEHKFETYVSDNNATCCDDGTKTAKCKWCDETHIVADEGSALGHIDSSKVFKDVPATSWYKPHVDYAVSHGIFKGTSADIFSPNTNMTRAQFVQVFANLSGFDTSDNNVDSGFSDVPKGKWFTSAVAWAAKNGIVNGMGDGTFAPNANVTREQMCVMLVNYVEKYQKKTLENKVDAPKFADDSVIAGWSKTAVYKCANAGLVNGVGDGKFDPKSSATRAQGATIFSNFFKEYMK